jgi:hypothetical protein
MHFCIFCGHSLAAEAEAPAVTAVPPPQPPSAPRSEALPVNCPACGRTDTHNSVFCIFCGARIVRGDSGTAVTEAPARQTAGPPASVLIGVAVVLGLGCGVALGLAGKSMGLERYWLSKTWEPGGLVIYTCMPRGKLMIESADATRVVVGQLAADGSCAYNQLQPDEYTVSVSDASGGKATQKVRVTLDAPTVLGYPKRLAP